MSDQLSILDPDGRSVRGNDGFRIPTAVIMQVIGWVIGVLLAYGAVNARVSVLESKTTDTDRRLNSIELKIDVLLARGVKP